MAKNIYQRINSIMAEVRQVQKNARVRIGGGGYTAVTHDDVAALLHPQFVKHGVVATKDVVKCETVLRQLEGNRGPENRYETQVTVEVTYVNVDDSSDKFTVRSHGFCFENNGDKAIGKAISYAVKYAHLKQFDLESCDNEEDRVAQSSGAPRSGMSDGARKFHSDLVKRVVEKVQKYQGSQPTAEQLKKIESKSIDELKKYLGWT